MSRSSELAPHVELDDHPVLTSSCSWTDRTLAEQADFYPKRSRSAGSACASTPPSSR